MTITKEKILKIEKDAENLIKNLNLLYEKAGSYNAAKESLQNTNTFLQRFVSEIKSLTESSNTVIKNLKEIGASKLSDQLTLIDNNIQRSNTVLRKIKSTQIFGFTFIVSLQLAILIIVYYKS